MQQENIISSKTLIEESLLEKFELILMESTANIDWSNELTELEKTKN